MSVDKEDRDKIMMLIQYVETRDQTAKALKKLIKLAEKLPHSIFYELGAYFFVKECQHSLEDKVRIRAEKFLEICREPEKDDESNNKTENSFSDESKQETLRERVISIFGIPLAFSPTPSPPHTDKMIGQLEDVSQSRTNLMNNGMHSGKHEQKCEKYVKHTHSCLSSLGDTQTSTFSDYSSSAYSPPPRKTSIQTQRKRSPTDGIELNEEMIKPRKERMKVFSGTKKSPEQYDPMYDMVRSSNAFTIDAPFNVIKPYLCEMNANELTNFLKRNPQYNARADHLFKKFFESEFQNSETVQHGETWQQRYFYEKNEKEELAKKQFQEKVDKVKNRTVVQANTTIVLDSLPVRSDCKSDLATNSQLEPSVKKSPNSRGNPIRTVPRGKEKPAPNMAHCMKIVKHMKRK